MGASFQICWCAVLLCLGCACKGKFWLLGGTIVLLMLQIWKASAVAVLVASCYFSIAKVQKSGRKKHKVRWMSKRAMAIPQVIIELQDQALRESTLRSQYFPSRVTEEVVNEGEKNVASEKPAGEEEATDVNKENPQMRLLKKKNPRRR
ncbi:hypothetical protein TEA_014449 [Camellia sinensis var. sinensis]|uniref:Uncharacterized protein n=1 Tax=Camellia sinensis var. sinensis TaxID=542762 RepID=A0A4S4EKS0_CAMSN|nr:hypothetical protein TEA_014449 [Camellia sinensis var. sinensis]